MLKLLVIFAVFVACNGAVVRRAQRNDIFNIEYEVYTRLNNRQPVSVTADRVSVTASPLLRTRNTVVLIHEHKQGDEGSAKHRMKTFLIDAFLSAEDMNIIVVDWSFHEDQPVQYAFFFAQLLGNLVAEFFKIVIAANKADWTSMHVVGLGFDAHIAGLAGRNVNGNIFRITGLDPVADMFDSSPNRLKKDDAKYVEVIHTDTEGDSATGTKLALGHVDFFVNKGGPQPGCKTNECSHNRAWELLAASMVSKPLVGHLCTGEAQPADEECGGYTIALGTNTLNKYVSGSFGVVTGCKFPYHDNDCPTEDDGK